MKQTHTNAALIHDGTYQFFIQYKHNGWVGSAMNASQGIKHWIRFSLMLVINECEGPSLIWNQGLNYSL